MGKEDKIFSSGIGIPVARLNLPMVAERAATDPHHSNTSPSFRAATVTMAPLNKSSVTKTFADSRDHFTKALASMQTSSSNLTSRPSSPSLSGYVPGTTQISNVQQQAKGSFGLPTVSRADLDNITVSLASRVTVGSLGDGNSPLLAHLSSLRTQRQGPSQVGRILSVLLIGSGAKDDAISLQLSIGYQGAFPAGSKNSVPSQPGDITKVTSRLLIGSLHQSQACPF